MLNDELRAASNSQIFIFAESSYLRKLLFRILGASHDCRNLRKLLNDSADALEFLSKKITLLDKSLEINKLDDEFDLYLDHARSQINGTQGPWRVITICERATRPLFNKLVKLVKQLEEEKKKENK